MLRQLANSSMPFTLLGCNLPISSIIQCTLKSPNFLETFSLKTLISMMFTIALTSMSVPSEPTFAIFSTQPVSLSFSIMRNCRLKVSETTRLFLEGSSFSSLLKALRYFTALRFTFSRESCENKSIPPMLKVFSSLKFFISIRSCISLSLLGKGLSSILRITPAKLRLTKSSLISLMVLLIRLSLWVSSPVSFDMRLIMFTYLSLMRFWYSVILLFSTNSHKLDAKSM